MNYRGKRQKAKLSRYFVSKQIGIPYKVYKDIEENKRSLNEESMNKFHVVVENEGNEYSLKEKIEGNDAKAWVKDKNLESLLKEFNITKEEVLLEIGISNSSLYNVFTGKTNNNELFIMVKDYFTNSLNKRYKPREEREITNSIYDWSEVRDFLGYIKDVKFEAALGLSTGNLSNWKRGGQPRQKTINKIESMLNEKGRTLDSFKFENKIVAIEEPTEEIIEEPIIEEPINNNEFSQDEFRFETDSYNGETEEYTENEVESDIVVCLKEEIVFLKQTIKTLNKLISKE